MIEYLALALLLYIIYRFFVDGSDNKDRKRWPALMREEEKLFELAKTTGDLKMKEIAAKMRKQRKKARKDKMLAKELDRSEKVVRRAHVEYSAQRHTADLERQVSDMQWKINDLEWKNRYGR